MLRHQRGGEERLRRRRAFLRRTGDQGARYEVLRAASRRRLLQDPGRQDDGLLIGSELLDSHAAPLRTRDSIPAMSGVGLRFRLHQGVMEPHPASAWFEAHTENY